MSLRAVMQICMTHAASTWTQRCIPKECRASRSYIGGGNRRPHPSAIGARLARELGPGFLEVLLKLLDPLPRHDGGPLLVRRSLPLARSLPAAASLSVPERGHFGPGR